MKIEWTQITSLKQFKDLLETWDCSQPVACDVETAKDVHLLGVSLAPQITRSKAAIKAVYIPLVHWDGSSFAPVAEQSLVTYLFKWLSGQSLVGHNFTYDKPWIDRVGSIDSTWIADTRLMYHLNAAPAGPKPYGLKDAQVEVLAWTNRGDEELKSAVESKGGRLKDGDHFLAPLETLAKYAALDAYSTICIYDKLSFFFDTNEYWNMLDRMMEFQQLLEKGTEIGIETNISALEKTQIQLTKKKEAAANRFKRLLQEEINDVEEAWRDRRVSLYKREYNRARYLNHPEEWERFNLNSDKQKRELFYDKLQLPVSETTEKGLPAVNEDSIRAMLRTQADGKVKEALEAYLLYEQSNTLTANFTQLYLRYAQSSVDKRFHPRYNICGTVSYRLAGFKPHLLNAPFSEKKVMKHFRCDSGWVGIHADLVAVEPTLTAHYSDDPSMLKVFRDGLGDIYLDLALDLFPDDKELRDGYNPHIPITGSIKERFARQRKISKIIQLAVSYTGTGHTVAKNLSRDGLPTTVEEATVLVRAYWKKFRRVREFQWRLRELYKEQNYLRNCVGRIIRVPDPEYKDLFNRFIQSGGHDVLISWVLDIYRLCNDCGIPIKPILLDCHDSTSNQVREEDVERVKEIYRASLENVNQELQLSAPLKMEMKTFKTLAGLKGDEK